MNSSSTASWCDLSVCNKTEGAQSRWLCSSFGRFRAFLGWRLFHSKLTHCHFAQTDLSAHSLFAQFLIIQRRLFSSHYFCHVINEAKASLILASRGNELIEGELCRILKDFFTQRLLFLMKSVLRVKECNQEADRERQILQKIKTKMDRIKATQQRVLEEHEPKHHAAGKILS